MGRRHSIAARKASGDAQKSKIYAKIGKIIQIAAKKGADASMNPGLELALQKARYHGLPRDVIDKAILKGSGQLGGEDLQEMIFEGYGPGGTAIIIKALTENTNRTSMHLKTILGKVGGSLGKPGSVAWNFSETGVFALNGKILIKKEKGNDVKEILSLDQEEAELELMNLSLKDIEVEEEGITLLVEKNDFFQVQKSLVELSYNIVEGAIHFLPNDTLQLDADQREKLQQLIGQLEEDDDVDMVYHNGKK